MDKQAVILRAENDGRKAGVAQDEGDQARVNFHHRDLDKLCALFPEWRDELCTAYADAYRNERGILG